MHYSKFLTLIDVMIKKTVLTYGEKLQVIRKF